MAKAKPDKQAEKAEQASEAAAPASQKDDIVLERQDIIAMDAEAKAAEKKAAEANAVLEAKRKKVAEAHAKFLAEKKKKLDIENRAAATEPSIVVIVQTKRERLVRLKRGSIPSRTPVLVTRRELRKLQGMANHRAIQLIVGELEKPGTLIDTKTGKPIEGA